MEGILLINKPVGPSSFEVVQRVRRLSGVKKVGHAGTLDPLASGLLVVCLGRYTKLAAVLTNGKKTYDAIFRLGIKTSTDDREGETLASADTSHLQKRDLEQALLEFVGPIKQIPPTHSAVKIKGQRAYHMARANQSVELAPREVTIYSVKIIDYGLPEIGIKMECSKGTYVRSLARDLGEKLGVGAHALAIHRVQSGAFSVDQAIPLADLTQETILKNLLSDTAAVRGLELIEVDGKLKNDIIHGRQNGLLPSITSDVGIAIYDNRLVAILGNKNGQMVLSRVF